LTFWGLPPTIGPCVITISIIHYYVWVSVWSSAQLMVRRCAGAANRPCVPGCLFLQYFFPQSACGAALTASPRTCTPPTRSASPLMPSSARPTVFLPLRVNQIQCRLSFWWNLFKTLRPVTHSVNSLLFPPCFFPPGVGAPFLWVLTSFHFGVSTMPSCESWTCHFLMF